MFIDILTLIIELVQQLFLGIFLIESPNGAGKTTTLKLNVLNTVIEYIGLKGRINDLVYNLQA